MDEKGRIIRKNERIGTNSKAIKEFFSSMDQAEVVIESSGIWEYVYEIIDSLGFHVTLSNPAKTRIIAEAKIKTDKIDSEILAHLLRADLIPKVWIGDKEIRELKRVVYERTFLKKQSTQLKNRIHSELLRRGVKPEMDLFTKKGKAHLLSLDIRSVKRLFTLFEATEVQIKDLNKELRGCFENNGDAKILTTMKGMGHYSALAVVAVIGDVNRFRDSEALCSYLGIVPSTHQSANTIYHGRITKQGSANMRLLLIQCAWVHVTKCKNSSLTQFYNRLAKKKGKHKAIVATTRKMIKAIYWMLKDKEPC